jgi:putative photosynthetic complex assembly protein 2
MLGTFDIVLLMLYACLVWWGSTGLILSLMARAEATYRWSMLGGVLAGVAALGGLLATESVATVEGAIIGFVCGIALWGAVEMALLMGFVVGPRRTPCPSGLTGWSRFRASAAALAYHEAALAGVLGLLIWLLKDADNPIALQIFALLWVMRLSTKFNIFLGVSNAGIEVLPPRIAYLATYFRTAPINPLFPISVTAATTLVVLLAVAAASPSATPHGLVCAVLLATFAGLGLLEHWLLVLPLPTTTLWPFARRNDETRNSTASVLAGASPSNP